MQKLIFLLIINLLLLNNIFSQIAYSDAAELAKHINSKGELKSDDLVVFSILSKYLPDSCKLTSKETFENIFNGVVNPYLKLTKKTKQNTTISIYPISSGSPAGIFLNRINIKPSALIPIINNEELCKTFFINLKNSFDSNAGLRLLLPVTYKFVSTINENSILLMMSILKEGFLLDLNNILVNLPGLITDEKDIDIISKYPDLANYLGTESSSSSGITKILQGMHPVFIIKDFSKQPEVKSLNRNLNNSLNMMSLFSESLRDTLSNSAWISLKLFNDDYLKDPNIFKIYLGLLYQKGNNIMFKIKNEENNYHKLTTLQGFLKENKDKMNKLFQYFYYFLKYSNNIDNIIKDIKEIHRTTDTIPQVNYYNYLNSYVNFVEYGLDYTKLFSPFQKLNDSLIYTFIDLTQKGCDIYKNLNERNYNAAVMNAFFLYEYSTNFENVEKRVKSDLTSENLDENFREDYKTILLSIKGNKVMKEELLKYLVFASYFVQSNSNEEILSAIESIAYPYGKTNKNKQNFFTINLNSYLGLSCGNENLTGNNINVAGIFAPVGITFKKGISRKNNQYLGFLISFFNIGELTSIRLQNSYSNNLPEMRIENIFTPGGYFIYGCSKMPLTFGFGSQYGPEYRNINNVHVHEYPFNFSLNLFLAVDLTFYNFYTKAGTLKKQYSKL